ncbi:P-loop NTPase family protein [Gulosibacter molinativorax]|uniref:DUF1611 domain-containing protein n=1 Tax=Gulosibacter molinativorax TaxID=256821 RepID=UPI001FE00451|nr:DUF1611 domain-containing protein [Gulosibacter molinativorax]
MTTVFPNASTANQNSQTTDGATNRSAGISTAPIPIIVRTELPKRIQAAYTTRFVDEAIRRDPEEFHLLSGPGLHPRSGDVVVARVTNVGNHKRIETPTSRKAILFEGALVMVAYGNRYAADQFLAYVPDSLATTSLVAAGGLAGEVVAAHTRVSEPTEIEPLGLLANHSGVVNLNDFAPFENLPVTESRERRERPEVIGVLGTSMNSGKSTVMANLINGLAKSGRTVTAGKITGTGAGNDPMIYHDAGAAKVLDFTDFGYPTTFQLDMQEILALTINLVEHLTEPDTDVVVVEIADGIFQDETAKLLRDPIFHNTIDQVLFAATDALGARAGVHELCDVGLKVAAASGVLTSSPLATREANDVLAKFETPVLGTFDLSLPEVAESLLLRK